MQPLDRARIACYPFAMSEMTIARRAVAHRGRRLEYFTIAWNTLEGLVGVGTGLLAGSIKGTRVAFRLTRLTGSCS